MPAVSDKSVADKLGIKAGKSVLIVNEPAAYRKTLGALNPAAVVATTAGQPVDIIQVFIENRQQLEKQLPQLKKQLKSGGALWVSYYKGTSKIKTDINRDSIAAYALTIGLEGVAIISVDDDWSSLRLKQVD
jgi:hypothetical protein